MAQKGQNWVNVVKKRPPTVVQLQVYSELGLFLVSPPLPFNKLKLDSANEKHSILLTALHCKCVFSCINSEYKLK